MWWVLLTVVLEVEVIDRVLNSTDLRAGRCGTGGSRGRREGRAWVSGSGSTSACTRGSRETLRVVCVKAYV